MTKSRTPIAFVLGNLEVGGAEKRALRLAIGLREHGFETHFILLQDLGPLREQVRQNGFTLDVLGTDFSRGILNLSFPFQFFRSCFRLIKLLRKYHCKAVLSFLFWQDCITVPVCALLPGVRRAITQRVCIGTFKSLRPHYRVAEIFNNLLAGGIIANSGAVWRDSAAHERFFRRKSVMIVNGIESTPSPAEPLPLPDHLKGRWLMGNIANMKRVKRWDVFLQTLARVRQSAPEVAGVIAGKDKGELPRLKQLAADLGLEEHLWFCGEVPSAQHVLPHLNALVMTSDAEGFSNTLLEAAAFGVPIVSTNVGGAEELIVSGQTGFCTPLGDVEGLAKAVLAIHNDPGLASTLARNAHQLTQTTFSNEQMVAAYAGVLQTVLQHGVLKNHESESRA